MVVLRDYRQSKVKIRSRPINLSIFFLGSLVAPEIRNFEIFRTHLHRWFQHVVSSGIVVSSFS